MLVSTKFKGLPAFIGDGIIVTPAAIDKNNVRHCSVRSIGQGIILDQSLIEFVKTWNETHAAPAQVTAESTARIENELKLVEGDRKLENFELNAGASKGRGTARKAPQTDNPVITTEAIGG